MDLGELPTGIESPLIPVLLWGVLGLVTAGGLVVTVVAVRRGLHRGTVLLIAVGLLVLAVGAGLALWFRYDLAGAVDPSACQVIPDGAYFATFASSDEFDIHDIFRRCLDLQYRVAAFGLAGYALASGIGGLAQLRLSAR